MISYFENVNQIAYRNERADLFRDNEPHYAKVFEGVQSQFPIEKEHAFFRIVIVMEKFGFTDHI